MGSNVTRKERRLFDELVELDDTTDIRPALGSGPVLNAAGHFVRRYQGDFAGALVMAMEWHVTNVPTTTFTSLDARLVHSDNGTEWNGVDDERLIFAQVPVSSPDVQEIIQIQDTAVYTMRRFLALEMTVVGGPSTGMNVEFEIYYQQNGPPGELAYGGVLDRYNG